MQQRLLWPAIVSAVLLAACGGGEPASTTANVTLSGTAAKGLMANADVAALPVNADGSIGTAALATDETGPDGTYQLSFDATQGLPYVIQVSAKADGSTTHLDEVSGVSQPLPAGFEMRALFVPATTGTVTTSASVTPFSEMAVAAAEGASGGVTAANAAQAISTVSQLLGFDPTTVIAKPVASAATANEQKLAVLLTAVSQLANSGELGCATSADAGERVACVVDMLASATSTTSIKLQTADFDVSAALGAAVATVLADPDLSGAVTSATLTAVVSNLACTEPCTAAPTSTQLAITAAKLLFTELKSDWQTMFSEGGISDVATGAANAEAWKFRQAMTNVEVPVAPLVKDLGALLMAADLYNDYMSGRTTVNSRGRAPDATPTNTFGAQDFNAVSCQLYQAADLATPATAPSNANVIGCRASYFVTVNTDVAGTTVTDWRHGFTITPASDGSFDYQSRASQHTEVNGVTTANIALQLNSDGTERAAFTGKLIPTLDGALGKIVGFSVNGGLPAAFVLDDNVLANDRLTWSLSGTRTISGISQEVASMAGDVTAYNADDTVANNLEVKSLSTSSIPVTAEFTRPSATAPATQGEIATMSIDLVLTTAQAEFEGVFAATDSVWDASGTEHAPTRLTLSGALRNFEAGVTTEFLKGVFSATIDGGGSYDATQPDSATNRVSLGASFVGTVTAPNRPVLEVSVGGSKTSDTFEDGAGTLTVQYRTLVNGAPRMVINATATQNADGTGSATITEATANLSLTLTSGQPTANLLSGGATIGTVDSTGLLTFTDRTFISLDIGQ